MKDPTIGILFVCLTGIIGISAYLSTGPAPRFGLTVWVAATIGVLAAARWLEKRSNP